MPDDPLLDDVLDDVLDLADAASTLRERAQAWLRLLDRVVAFDAAWLSVSMPGSGDLRMIASSGLEPRVRDVLDSPQTSRDVRDAGLLGTVPPMSTMSFRDAFDGLPVWSTCLGPAGFGQILGAALVEPGGTCVGIVGLLFLDAETPSAASRSQLARLSPLIARALSPANDVMASARLVPGADAGVLLLTNGTVRPLPGLLGHDLLRAGSPAVQIAHHGLAAGVISWSFLWPVPVAEHEGRHARLTSVAAAGPAGLGGLVLLLTVDADCHGLTPRELQVLGQLVDGRSNQQISRSLAVAPRTVATHVEHVMRKLEAPSRTLAAVRAEREGLCVPPPQWSKWS